MLFLLVLLQVVYNLPRFHNNYHLERADQSGSSKLFWFMNKIDHFDEDDYRVYSQRYWSNFISQLMMIFGIIKAQFFYTFAARLNVLLKANMNILFKQPNYGEHDWLHQNTGTIISFLILDTMANLSHWKIGQQKI